MFGRIGKSFSVEDIFTLLVDREGVRDGCAITVARDEAGFPCSSRRVVHRGGVLKKSLVPIGRSWALAAEGVSEKKAAILLSALPCVVGMVSQPILLKGPSTSWIPDYAVILKPFRCVLLEVRTEKWLTDERKDELRMNFEMARRRGFEPVLWTDTWLGRNALVSNLAYLAGFDGFEVDVSHALCLQQMLSKSESVRLADLADLGEPRLMHSVYALIAQGRIHADLERPLGVRTVIRISRRDETESTYAPHHFFRGSALQA